jgi:hypothetical protein
MIKKTIQVTRKKTYHVSLAAMQGGHDCCSCILACRSAACASAGCLISWCMSSVGLMKETPLLPHVRLVLTGEGCALWLMQLAGCTQRDRQRPGSHTSLRRCFDAAGANVARWTVADSETLCAPPPSTNTGCAQRDGRRHGPHTSLRRCLRCRRNSLDCRRSTH